MALGRRLLRATVLAQRDPTDYEGVPDALLEQALPGFLELLDRDDLDPADDPAQFAEGGYRGFREAAD